MLKTFKEQLRLKLDVLIKKSYYTSDAKCRSWSFFSLGAGRRPSQGFASVFSYHLSCSEFPERLQNLNSDIEPGY